MTAFGEPAAVVAALRRRWTSGELLRMHAGVVPWAPIAVPIRRPRPGEVAEHFDDVRAWAARWADAQSRLGVRVETTSVGGRLVGTNQLPARAWVDVLDVAWRLLGVRQDVERFDQLLASTRDDRLRAWAVDHPMRALELADAWPRLLMVVDWVRAHEPSGRHLRQIDAPGVDTKFIEQHQKVLSQLLEVVLPADRIDLAVPPGSFARRHGFASKPEYIRLRHLDPSRTGFTELTVRADELAARPPRCSRVVAVENEITYLALPPVADTVAIFTSGKILRRFRQQAWLFDCDVAYWGDIDTHGFAILDEFRALFPHSRSLLMDRGTLLDHRVHWDVEPVPHRGTLTHLRPAEASLYDELQAGVFGDHIRLEQERVRFSRVDGAMRRWAEQGRPESGDDL